MRDPHPLWNDIRNNIFVSQVAGGLFSFSKQLPYTNFFERNIYWAPNAPWLASYRQYLSLPSVSYPNLAAWQLGQGQDPSGIQADPVLVNANKAPFDLRPKAGSPAIGAARNTVSWVVNDFEGTPRPAMPSIGAYESQPDFTVFGSGCAGTANLVPVLGFSGSLKRGSTDFAVTLQNARTGTGVLAFLALGVSTSSWGSVPLPLGGGCSLLVSLDIVLTQTVTAGAAKLTVPIPGDPKLFNAKAHFQWGVVDPAAGGIGLAMSNAGTLTL